MLQEFELLSSFSAALNYKQLLNKQWSGFQKKLFLFKVHSLDFLVILVIKPTHSSTDITKNNLIFLLEQIED